MRPGLPIQSVSAMTMATRMPMVIVITLKLMDFFTNVGFANLMPPSQNADFSLFSWILRRLLFKIEHRCFSSVQLVPRNAVQVTVR